jgi:hypothetical protein
MPPPLTHALVMQWHGSARTIVLAHWIIQREPLTVSAA